MWGGGGRGGSTLQAFYTLLWNMSLNKCLMINLCMLILCVLVVSVSVIMKCTRLGHACKRAL